MGESGQGTWELRQGATLLGRFTINQEDSDFPWYGGDFAPTAAIDVFRDLFAREWAASEEEDFDEADTVMDKLRQQGVVLVDMLSGEVVSEYLLHLDVDGKKGWFRYWGVRPNPRKFCPRESPCSSGQAKNTTWPEAGQHRHARGALTTLPHPVA